MSEAKKLKEVSEPSIPSFQMLELAPTKVMFADSNGVLNYLNKASQDTLKVLEQYLPDKVENLVGKSIDWFHKNPEIQQKIISSPQNLPHRAIIQLGPEQLDLLVSAVMDENNNYIGPMVCWEVVTEKLKIESEAARASNMVDLNPINTMLADKDGVLLYMNQNSMKTLQGLEQYLPDKVTNLVGKSIDWFHKNPEHQRKIIGDPSNLPHRAVIQLGPEKLDLLVSPIMDKDNNYIGPMVTWEVVTEKLKLEEEQARTMSMVEKSALNTMMCSPDGDILTVNEASRNTLRTLEQYLPVKVNEIIGQKVDIFHKNPEMQRKVIGSASNLPHRAIIQLGPEKLDLNINAVMGNNGEYLGAMVTWDVVTTKFELVEALKKSGTDLSTNAHTLQDVSQSLSASAEETSAQSNTASAASEQVNAGVQTVASNMEEMVAAIKEITKTTNEASNLSNDAMKMATDTDTIIGQLGDSSNDIGNVIKVISSIAQQTNLLALNATIEAARAGEAGKGFAVVANEVKELAKQTGTATQDITKRIENIQQDSKSAVDAIAQIREAIEKINGYAGNIAASVEEQAATTNEVTRIVTESAEGVKQINENIAQVSEAAANTGKDALKAQEASKLIADISKALEGFVAKIEV
jgi:methyl-accepting chemotaxis protein